MSQVTIYHNPRCRKSREALQILQHTCEGLEIIDYLRTPPSEDQLVAIINKLKMAPAALIRKNEAVYKEKYKGKELSDEEWIKAMVNDPILIERPIVIKDDVAVVARPPEKVNQII